MMTKKRKRIKIPGATYLKIKMKKTDTPITRTRVPIDRLDLIRVPFPKETLVDPKKEAAKKNQAADADA